MATVTPHHDPVKDAGEDRCGQDVRIDDASVHARAHASPTHGLRFRGPPFREDDVARLPADEHVTHGRPSPRFRPVGDAPHERDGIRYRARGRMVDGGHGMPRPGQPPRRRILSKPYASGTHATAHDQFFAAQARFFRAGLAVFYSGVCWLRMYCLSVSNGAPPLLAA